jgi:hypothetical protein
MHRGVNFTWQDIPPREQARLDKAIMLSGGNLTICEALLRGEHVPVNLLAPEWVKRYGIRP